MKTLVTVLAVAELAGLVRAQVFVPPSPPPVYDTPQQWAIDLDAAQTAEAVAALAAKVQLQGLDLTALQRATLMVNLQNGPSGVTARVMATVWTNAPAGR